MKELDDSVKNALIWEVQDGAVDLFIKRWKFRISLAIAIAVVAIAVLGFSLRPWMDGIARDALSEKIDAMTELESAAIRQIKLDQAIELQGLVVAIQKTRRQAEDEANQLLSARDSLEEVVESVSYLKEHSERLPALATALQSVDQGGLEHEERLQAMESLLAELVSAFKKPVAFDLASDKGNRGSVGPKDIGRHSFCALSYTQDVHGDDGCGCLVQEQEGVWYLSALKEKVTGTTCRCRALCLSEISSGLSG